MKKSIILATAALALVACNKSEVVAVNNGGAIEFRTSVKRSTKAADITTSTLSEFTVTAINHGSSDK